MEGVSKKGEGEKFEQARFEVKFRNELRSIPRTKIFIATRGRERWTMERKEFFSSRGGNTFETPGRGKYSVSLSLSRCIARILYDKQRCIFATRPRLGAIEALPSRERVERNMGGKKGRGAIMMGLGTRVYTRVYVCYGPVRRQIGTYNHRDYLVLGIDHGFA